jgi:hypothetical protein
MDHISPTAIGHSIDWFQRTLKGGTPKPADDQTWYWKEAGTLIALIGFALFVLGVFDALLALPFFAVLRHTAASDVAARDGRWWLALALGALVPALTFLPFARLGGALLPASTWLPQLFTNEIAFWALANALIIFGASYLPGTPKARLIDQPLRALALAASTVVIAYALVATIQFLFTVDFRFWFIAFKPMSRWQAAAFPVYLVVFTIFFTIALRSLHTVLTPRVQSAAGQYGVTIVALAGGFAAFLLVQYGLMFSTNQLLTFHMFDPLRVIISINFVPLMCFMAVVSTFAYRRTGHHLPGALVCAALVAWYVVVGQATQAA